MLCLSVNIILLLPTAYCPCVETRWKKVSRRFSLEETFTPMEKITSYNPVVEPTVMQYIDNFTRDLSRKKHWFLVTLLVKSGLVQL